MNVPIRFNYDKFEGSSSSYLFVDSQNCKMMSGKKMLVFVHYYGNVEQYYGTQFIEDEYQIPELEWLIINDCNISSSTRILPWKNSSTIQFDNLIGLDLSFNSISDFGSIEHIIKSSPNLQYLDLSHNPIEFQQDLQEIILKGNHGISSINRKRVTPTPFYNIYIKNQSYHDFEDDEIKNFFKSQIKAAIRTVEKDRIYPPSAEQLEPCTNPNILSKNWIDLSYIQAIDLSNCDLVYFDFDLFPKAFFIDISNNYIQHVDFKGQNKTLLYLDISNNDYKGYDTLERIFPDCKIYPLHLAKRHSMSYLFQEEEPVIEDGLTFETLISSMQVTLKNTPPSNLITSVNIDANKSLKGIVKFVNTDEENNDYKINSESIIQIIKSADNKYEKSIANNVKITYNEINFNFEPSTSSLSPFFFIAYLNLKDVSISQNDFSKIARECKRVKHLIIKLPFINTDIDFKDFSSNELKELTDFDIYFDNYLFKTTKDFNKLIKQIRHISHLKNLNMFNYTNDYSENDEIDTTFKFLRGLDTFNGYRNLIPPTPAQYVALRSKLPIEHSNNNNNNDNDNDNDNENIRQNKQYQNLNNLSLLLLYKKDLTDTDNEAIKYSNCLPIREIQIVGVEETKSEVQDTLNKNSEFFDRYARFKHVNGLEIKKELKPQEDTQNESEAFDSWTSKVDKALEIFSQLQFFYLYSVKSSSSFVSKFLFFIYSTLIAFERFFLRYNLKFSTDFTSSWERLILLSIAPILALKLLYWDPSYGKFIDIAKKESETIRNFILIAVLALVILIIFSIVDSKFFEQEVVVVPYIFQFFIFLILWILTLTYYMKKIRIRQGQAEDGKETLQEKNSFGAYLEFKYFKSKVAYSCLIILVIPILSIIFNSELSFTFVDTYKVLFTSTIILIITTLLFFKTNDQCNKIIDYLDFNRGTKKKKSVEDKSTDELLDKDRTHYFVIESNKKKTCNPAKIFEGAFQYKLTTEDNLYKKFAEEYRTPTQIFYSSYRYRGLQRFYGLIEIIQRILTEIISKINEIYLFIVPLFSFFYVLIWWPHYDNIINISTLLSSFGKLLMSLFNFLFYYFGYDDNNNVQSALTYMNILGMALNIIGISLLGYNSLHNLTKLEEDESENEFEFLRTPADVNI